MCCSAAKLFISKIFNLRPRSISSICKKDIRISPCPLLVARANGGHNQKLDGHGRFLTNTLRALLVSFLFSTVRGKPAFTLILGTEHCPVEFFFVVQWRERERAKTEGHDSPPTPLTAEGHSVAKMSTSKNDDPKSSTGDASPSSSASASAAAAGPAPPRKLKRQISAVTAMYAKVKTDTQMQTIVGAVVTFDKPVDVNEVRRRVGSVMLQNERMRSVFKEGEQKGDTKELFWHVS